MPAGAALHTPQGWSAPPAPLQAGRLSPLGPSADTRDLEEVGTHPCTLLPARSPEWEGRQVLASSACFRWLSTWGDFLQEGPWIPVETFTGQPRCASEGEALSQVTAFSSTSAQSAWKMSQRALGVHRSSPRPRNTPSS